MYLSYFGLTHKPFAQVPQIQCLFPAPATIEAMESLRFGLLTQHSICLLTSGPGLGKSLILQALVEELNSTHKPIYIPTTGIPGRAALLQSILFELKRPYAHLGEQELRLSLIAAARDLQQTRLGIVLLLDELHLADDEILQEIRTLTSFAELGRPLFSVIAAGQVELEDRLTHPKHVAFNQRIGCHVVLSPLSRQESINYIGHQIAWAEGRVETIFTGDALDLIAQVSAGIPRNINLICDQSMMLAYAESESLVDHELVEATLREVSKLQVNSNFVWSPAAESQSMTQVNTFVLDGSSAEIARESHSSTMNMADESATGTVSFEIGYGIKQAPSIETLRQPLTSASTATIVHELASLDTLTSSQTSSSQKFNHEHQKVVRPQSTLAVETNMPILPEVKKSSPTGQQQIEEFILEDRYTNLDYARQLMAQSRNMSSNKNGMKKSDKIRTVLPTAATTKIETTEVVDAYVDALGANPAIVVVEQEMKPITFTDLQFDVVMPDDDVSETLFKSPPVAIEAAIPVISVTEIPSQIAIMEVEEVTNLRLDHPAPAKKSRSFKNLFSKLRGQQ